MKQAVRIVGGGVSGLTAAIVLARHGADVEGFERRPVTTVHPVRWDAVENWSSAQDFGAQLVEWGIERAPFHPVTSAEVLAFCGERHVLALPRPLVYAAKR